MVNRNKTSHGTGDHSTTSQTDPVRQVDTIAKRLMSNQTRVASAAQFNAVIFKSTADAPLGTRMLSLFPGLGYAAAYKILQRVYKYGGQPFVRDYLAKNHGDTFDRTFGRGNGKAIMHAFAGRCISHFTMCI